MNVDAAASIPPRGGIDAAVRNTGRGRCHGIIVPVEATHINTTIVHFRHHIVKMTIAASASPSASFQIFIVIVVFVVYVVVYQSQMILDDHAGEVGILRPLHPPRILSIVQSTRSVVARGGILRRPHHYRCRMLPHGVQ